MFRRLGTAGLIEPQLAARLTGWAGLRNVLAHLYPAIDHGRIDDALGELGDLEALAHAINAMLDAAAGP